VHRDRLAGAVVEKAPTIANARSLRVIAASIAALAQGGATSATFLFRALCGVSPV